ncbi:MAG: hypothetical protein ATN33_02950 [Epulopiscium sp. Nele67-Bin001]|nr:MAG: hypothetical protein ATN33_02950 [Epulopiscium sp. Nele67-Bin001]
MNLERNLKFQQKYFKQYFDSYHYDGEDITTISSKDDEVILGDRIIILTDNLDDTSVKLFPELMQAKFSPDCQAINIFKGNNYSVKQMDNNEITCNVNHPYLVGNLFIKIEQHATPTDLLQAEIIIVNRKLSILENKKLDKYRFKTVKVSDIEHLKDILSYSVMNHQPLEIEEVEQNKGEVLKFGLNLNISLKIIANVIREVNGIDKIDPYSQNHIKDINNILLKYIKQQFEEIGLDWIKEYVTTDFYGNCYIVEQYLTVLDMFEKDILTRIGKYTKEIMSIVSNVKTQSDIYSAVLKTSVVEVDRIAIDYLSGMKTSYVN